MRRLMSLVTSTTGPKLGISASGFTTVTAPKEGVTRRTRKVPRVGALHPKTIDVRFVSATHRDLADMVKGGRFRADLYFRLNGISMTVPPLRERRDEIAKLAREFAAETCKAGHLAPVDLPRETITALERYHWPGNIRELRNVMERAVLLCPTGALIEPTHLPPAYRGASHAQPLRAQLADAERETLRDALARNDGIIRRAAKELGMDPVTLARRARKLGLR